MPDAPTSVRWTDHASAKASLLGFARTDVEDAVLRGHARRQRNVGAGDWRITQARLVVVYDHPDHDDPSTARIITLWRRR